MKHIKIKNKLIFKKKTKIILIIKQSLSIIIIINNSIKTKKKIFEWKLEKIQYKLNLNLISQHQNDL